MNRAEDLLNSPLDSLGWYNVTGQPVCEKLEPRYLRLLNSVNPSRAGAYILNDFVTGQFYRGSVLGLGEWGGPTVVAEAIFLIKNPWAKSEIETSYGFGERNGMFEYNDIVMAGRVTTEGLYLLRPVIRTFQRKLSRKLTQVLQVVDANQIANYQTYVEERSRIRMSQVVRV